MVKYRPSKSFVLTLLPLCALVAALGFGILPELQNFEAYSIPGEITFKNATPAPSKPASIPGKKPALVQRPLDLLDKGFEDLKKWKHNPWKMKPEHLGEHYYKLKGSKDPLDQAKCREIQRLADAWYQRLQLRYPELAISMKSVPDDQNGFLKWLDLVDKIKALNPGKVPVNLTFPNELDSYLNKKGAWNADAVRKWLILEKPLVDEIRAIGLLPERSVNGIPIDRWGFIPARFGKNCGEVMILEARLAAEQGDVARALESVRAARGLAAHFSEVETPSLLAITVNILMRLSLEHHVLSEIIPAIPAGQFDPVAWESALNPTVSQPSEFARILKGEWAVTSRSFLLPPLLDAEDPHGPPDSGELLDYHAMTFIDIVRIYEPANIRDLPTLKMPPIADASHLSRESQLTAGVLYIGMQAWRKGWDRAQSVSAMAQAAFAIMKGQPIPNDPIYGLPYAWDPATRQLSAPSDPAFDEMKLKPLTVPKP